MQELRFLEVIVFILTVQLHVLLIVNEHLLIIILHFKLISRSIHLESSNSLLELNKVLLSCFLGLLKCLIQGCSQLLKLQQLLLMLTIGVSLLLGCLCIQFLLELRKVCHQLLQFTLLGGD